MERKDVPPPPPLPMLSTTIRENIPDKYLLPHPQEEVSNICQRLWKYITMDNVENCVVSVYHQIRPIIQDGPKCGLVALCMASQLLSKELSVENVFNRAKILGFTRQGEMFSADNMRKLAKDLLQCQIDVIFNLKKHQDVIISHLLHELPVLIPYDADGNHEPCCKSGHTAHWAVITGFCIVLSENKSKSKFIGHQDPNLKQLYHWKGDVFPFSISDNEKIYVYARHGKSNKIGLWNFDCLCKSNANLRELGVKHINSDFIIPESGIFCELANQALLLH